MRHPAGPFTIFFWAPTFKWSITFANIGDMKKPAEKISPHQQIAVMMTGLIFTRWGLVINPINYNVSVCNFFMSVSAMYQIYRKMQVPEEKGGFWGHPKPKKVEEKSSIN